METDFRSVAPIAHISIRRDHVFEDGYRYLDPLGQFVQLKSLLLTSGSALKKRIGIKFVSSLGYQEAGIDGGGVFKEFFTEYVTHLSGHLYIFICITIYLTFLDAW